ncbi:hypothetical protein SUDANB105_02697 [Streptomyces sp. enrichment culture]|uniref:DUF192 domain-containing protein n=1 Tax=Streptomyces sp. enrichment culture TaxID=1795815 RepID=UPI003F577F5E
MRRRWRDGRGTLVVHAANGETHVPLEIATSYRARTKGLLGRDAQNGALLLTPAASIHTFGMRIPIDVAYLDRNFRVITVKTMQPSRLGMPRLRARHVVEAEAGSMAQWGMRPGVGVQVSAEEPPAG